MPVLKTVNMELYVTLEEARRQVNMPEGYEDVELIALIEAAQAQVEDDLQAPLSDYLIEGRLKRNIWHAIRILLATYYANKENIAYINTSNLPTYYNIIVKNKKIQ
jgi:hypothetical protein